MHAVKQHIPITSYLIQAPTAPNENAPTPTPRTLLAAAAGGRRLRDRVRPLGRLSSPSSSSPAAVPVAAVPAPLAPTQLSSATAASACTWVGWPGRGLLVSNACGLSESGGWERGLLVATRAVRGARHRQGSMHSVPAKQKSRQMTNTCTSQLRRDQSVHSRPSAPPRRPRCRHRHTTAAVARYRVRQNWH